MSLESVPVDRPEADFDDLIGLAWSDAATQVEARCGQTPIPVVTAPPRDEHNMGAGSRLLRVDVVDGQVFCIVTAARGK